ncbi:(2Fe-2S)-binding protein [Sphingosinicella microcystinivorans]|uniref:(2Fe-2S)-binding protein n=1 Tax=Sphingosinicella microcystinivorans TaxID=335406 RepID=UPI0022F3B063|nr:2Fe-2S iron-sulfur cluster-binding protein [Sphingosinicella microcystinivorans]WBX85205.1 2Fe-2S iron-sulfur cluster-binding protein [Sphingosinicella microcystinivorans]
MNGIPISFRINGTAVEAHVVPDLTLADFLRGDQGLKGTHIGCEEGVCGSCTVLADGETLRACLTLAAQMDGADITTVEGFDDPAGDRLRKAFAENFAAQCGFCTAGMMAVAREFLADSTVADHRDEVEIRSRLNAVVCRCTGYQAVVAAVRAAAAEQ